MAHVSRLANDEIAVVPALARAFPVSVGQVHTALEASVRYVSLARYRSDPTILGSDSGLDVSSISEHGEWWLLLRGTTRAQSYGKGLKRRQEVGSLCGGPAREGEGREPRHLTAKTADQDFWGQQPKVGSRWKEAQGGP